jgi:hypothetical protein
MVWIDHFRDGLLAQMSRAARHGRIDILINSGELHRSLGGYPGSPHGDALLLRCYASRNRIGRYPACRPDQRCRNDSSIFSAKSLVMVPTTTFVVLRYARKKRPQREGAC